MLLLFLDLLDLFSFEHILPLVLSCHLAVRYTLWAQKSVLFSHMIRA